jgi:esterase/lipase superfamily enzyme
MRKFLIAGISVLSGLSVVACGDSGTDKAMAPPPSASEDPITDKKKAVEPAEKVAEEAPADAVEEVEEFAAADRDEAAAGAARPETEIVAAPSPPSAVAPTPPAAATMPPAAANGGLTEMPHAAGEGKMVKRRSYNYKRRSGMKKKAAPRRGFSSPKIGAAPAPGGSSRGIGRGFAAPPSANLESMPVQPPAAPEPPSGAVPPAPVAPAAPDTSVALESLPPATAAPPAADAPKAEQKEQDWSVVPIFYGTDRQRTSNTTRVMYDWKRGRRLELGQALVTIPKKHEVPMVERPWALKIPYFEITLYEAAEDPKEHFTMKQLKSLTKEEFLSLVRQKLASSSRFKDHALVFVHGYQTKFDNAVFRTAQIAYDLKFDGASFLYSWPSGGTLQGYTYDLGSAAQAEPYLREFLKLVQEESGAKKLSIIAHSMGNQPLLRVLQDLKRSLPEGFLISQLILAAPDVDRHNFENIVTSIRGIAEGITLYAAANDTALQVSRQVNGGVPRAGDVPEIGPIVIEGIDTIDATATSMDSVGINHSGYAENNALLTDIGKLIGEGTRPPGVRLPTLERVETDKGAYWRYPPAGEQ